MYEEAALLVKRGICELYELPNIGIKPSEEEKKEVKSMEERYLIYSYTYDSHIYC